MKRAKGIHSTSNRRNCIKVTFKNLKKWNRDSTKKSTEIFHSISNRKIYIYQQLSKIWKNKIQILEWKILESFIQLVTGEIAKKTTFKNKEKKYSRYSKNDSTFSIKIEYIQLVIEEIIWKVLSKICKNEIQILWWKILESLFN